MFYLLRRFPFFTHIFLVLQKTQTKILPSATIADIFDNLRGLTCGEN